MIDDQSPSEEDSEPARKTKRERFLGMAEKRTQAVLDKLQVLGNCGNTATYEYEDEEVARIFAAIDEEVARTKAKFERRKKTNFRLR